ncbi:mechanosensitive ion channel family protein [Longivirga aurantiaca]|uniref:Mechanosensitive ion channel family protein n=1 Tax=Longivirga aurantiaca TaxID=1837743 RepID=A0ABW1T4A6_9ACTN
MTGSLLASTAKDTKAGNAAVDVLTSVWNWFLDYALTIGLTIAFSLLIWWICIRIIRRVTEQAKKRLRQDRPGQARAAEHTQELTAVLMTARREQRAEALGQLMRSIVTFTIFGLGILVVLAQAGVNLTPILASAGVVGVALGFGAQTLVKDFLSGIFLVLEDQFGVGDVVDLGPAIGTVEEVTLRITRVRDLSGIVWYVRNGEILRVGNRSQGWTTAVVDVPVAFNEDLDRVRRIVDKVGTMMDGDPAYDGILFGMPTYAGVESVSGDAMFVRVIAKAAPDQQMTAARAIREQIKLGFDEAGIKVPVLVRQNLPGSTPPATPPPA